MLSGLFHDVLEKVLLAGVFAILTPLWAWMRSKYESKPVGVKRLILVSLLTLVTAFVALDAIWYLTSPTRFDIRMSQSDGGIGPWFHQNQTFGYMTISIVNTSSPTVLRLWHMQIKTDDGKVYDGENTFLSSTGVQPTQQDQMALQGKPGTLSRVVYRSDFLPEKTVRQVIGTGAEVDGFLFAVFKGLPADFSKNAKGKLIVTCEDARGEKYKLESYPFSPGAEIELKAIPGMGH
jgi:hypothetical protein